MLTGAKLAGRKRAKKLWGRTCEIFHSMHPSPSKQELDLLPHLTPDTQFENILIICVPDIATRNKVEQLLNVDLQKVLALAAGMQISYVLRVGEPDDDDDLLDDDTAENKAGDGRNNADDTGDTADTRNASRMRNAGQKNVDGTAGNTDSANTGSTGDRNPVRRVNGVATGEAEAVNRAVNSTNAGTNSSGDSGMGVNGVNSADTTGIYGINSNNDINSTDGAGNVAGTTGTNRPEAAGAPAQPSQGYARPSARPAGMPLEDRPLPPTVESMRQSRLFDLPTTKQRERLARQEQARRSAVQSPASQPQSGAAPLAQARPASGQAPQSAQASRDIAPAATASGPRTNSVTISSAATDPETRLNPEQTFDTFVSGQSNRFARTAAYQVAESPGLAYNPLFVYADSGLGKTHLLNAIGNYALALQPNLRVRYVNSEHFTNEFINAVRNGSGNNNGINAFNEKYRDVDMLLIDDIQFLGGKTETLEQFFHTFNSLTTAKKQIVIASDVAPKRLKGFEERIVSRFDGGLTVNMDEPSIETRIAILRMKAQQLTEQARHTRNGHPVTVPEDVLNLIASQVTGNIRELEGALIRVVAMSSLSNEPVTQQLAQKTLQDYVVKDTQHTPMDIIRRTASYFGLQPNDIVSAKRSKKIAMARQIAMYLCREMTPLSLTAVGEIFGGRDHTTVIHAYKKINREMTQKREVYNYVNTLTTELKNPQQSDKTTDEA